MMNIFNFQSDWSPFTIMVRNCPNNSLLRLLHTNNLATKRHKMQSIWHERLMQSGNNQGIIFGKIYRFVTGFFFNSSSLIMCLSAKTYTIYPHHKKGDPKRQKQCACHADFEIDHKILRAAVERALNYSSKKKKTDNNDSGVDWSVSPLALLMQD